MSKIARLAAIVILLSTFHLLLPGNNEGVVRTTYGDIAGGRIEGGWAFLGIPFAEPPLGELRFRPPQPPSPWQGIREARTLPAPCPQRGGDGDAVGSEDCLYLNVWKPLEGSGLPVMFFLHGGGNMQGSTSVAAQGRPLYDGGRIVAAAPVVVVTIQYRIGALGFLAHPALSAESPRGASGNYGLLDQIAALRWVRENIAAFGGDPARVMLFGESAGALDTCMLVASPEAAGLFSRALMQSGGCRAVPLEQRQSEGADFAQKVGCQTADCLRRVRAETLVSAVEGTAVESDGAVAGLFGPTVDGWVLPDEPAGLIQSGKHNRTPFVIGANADETAAFVVPSLTEEAYRAAVVRQFGLLAGSLVLREYPASDFDSPRQALIAVTTDAQFVCPCRTIAAAMAESQSQPVFRYFFTHQMAAAGADRGAFHGLELFFLFQHLEADAVPRPRPEDLLVQRAMLDYWTAFAATGDPNNSRQPAWPRYAPPQDPFLELAAPPAAGNGVRTAKCDFWARVQKLLRN